MDASKGTRHVEEKLLSLTYAPQFSPARREKELNTAKEYRRTRVSIEVRGEK